MRLIDADALYKIIYDAACSTVLLMPNSDYAEGLHTASHYVEEAPTVKLESARRGKWMSEAICSECGFHRQMTRSGNFMVGNFCPKCGANMTGDRNET